MTRPVLAVLLLAAASPGAEPPGKPVKDQWDAAYIEGVRVGHVRTTLREEERDGKKVFTTTQALHLTIRRMGAVVPLRMETSVEETADGKIVGASVTQFLDGGKRLTQTGRVEGKQLVVRAGDAPPLRVPWDDAAVGPQAQERMLADKKIKPGDKLEVPTFELALLKSYRVRTEAKAVEEVDVLEAPGDGMGKARHVKMKLLRVESVGLGVDLPPLTSWLGDDYQARRSEMELPGLGKLTLYRTTEAVVKSETAAPELLPDLVLGTLVPLNRRLPNRGRGAAEVVYRVTVKDADDPATTFSRDARQEARSVKGNTFELVVRAERGPVRVEKPAPVADEYLRPSQFVSSDDAKVKELAALAVGDEKDAWQKARAIERFVGKRLKYSPAFGFVTAAQVARDLEGDCRQCALLTAALCRAAGLPARTATGLVYVEDEKRGPELGFHMWAEVHVQGQWLGLDPLFGGVGAGHLKVVDAAWSDAQPLASVVPLYRVLGRLKVEVVEVK